MTLLRNNLKRRTLLRSTAGFAALGLTSSLLPNLAQAADGLVALVHTQAAGDNGPVDSMIAKLKQLASEKGFTYRAIYAQDPATYETIFRTLGDAGAAVVVSTFNEVAEPFKAVAPDFPDTKFIQLFADAFEPMQQQRPPLRAPSRTLPRARRLPPRGSAVVSIIFRRMPLPRISGS